MESRRILLGITGSAAAFKGVMLASLLRKKGFQVDGVITPAGLKFVTETQLSSVTGRPVFTELFGEDVVSTVPHIHLTDDLDLFVVAPATADFMAKAAWGLANDLLSSVYLACDCSVVMAPAMNQRMWNNPATRFNVERLAEMGVVLAGPVEGELACGTTGPGRMMEPREILEVCLDALRGKG